jgi:fructose-bisphosphate aldolase class II
MNKEYLRIYGKARKKGYALGAFNVFNQITAEAVVEASNDLERPVVMEMSMSVVKKLGVKKATAILQTAIDQANHPVIMHLDHCTDPEIARKCILAGWHSIMYDGSKLSIEENIRETKELVEYAIEMDVLFEGEVGVIMGTEDHVVSDVSRLASYEETVDYMEKTGVDMIAPAIGTAHGLYDGKPQINFDLVKALSDLNCCPVVIHGGTGLSVEEFRRLVSLGAAKINVSTAIKHAYLDTMKALVSGNELTYNPLVVDQRIRQGVKDVILKHMRYFEKEA